VCSKHLEDIKIINQNINLENAHFVDLRILYEYNSITMHGAK
jgi:hypothetical protein